MYRNENLHSSSVTQIKNRNHQLYQLMQLRKAAALNQSSA